MKEPIRAQAGERGFSLKVISHAAPYAMAARLIVACISLDMHIVMHIVVAARLICIIACTGAQAGQWMISLKVIPHAAPYAMAARLICIIACTGAQAGEWMISLKVISHAAPYAMPPDSYAL